MTTDGPTDRELLEQVRRDVATARHEAMEIAKSHGYSDTEMHVARLLGAALKRLDQVLECLDSQSR